MKKAMNKTNSRSFIYSFFGRLYLPWNRLLDWTGTSVYYM